MLHDDGYVVAAVGSAEEGCGLPGQATEMGSNAADQRRQAGGGCKRSALPTREAGVYRGDEVVVLDDVVCV